MPNLRLQSSKDLRGRDSTPLQYPRVRGYAHMVGVLTFYHYSKEQKQA